MDFTVFRSIIVALVAWGLVGCAAQSAGSGASSKRPRQPAPAVKSQAVVGSPKNSSAQPPPRLDPRAKTKVNTGQPSALSSLIAWLRADPNPAKPKTSRSKKTEATKPKAAEKPPKKPETTKPEIAESPSEKAEAAKPASPEKPAMTKASRSKSSSKSKEPDPYRVGEAQMKAGDNYKAIASFRAAAKNEPGNAEIWERIAILYERSGDSESALKAFKRSKLVRPNKPKSDSEKH